MTEAPDAAILEQFATSKSEEAFAELVRRHIGLVHSVALRHTNNPEHAQEITQAVFIILARKAASLSPKTILSGWLYHTARLTAANFRRAEYRRIHREQEAFMQSATAAEDTDSAWREMSPLLEDAMTGLNRADRDAIVLRFFENKSLREVGAALELEERAAQKRVARGLEKLRAFFTKRGVVLTTAIIAGTVSAHSVQAVPAGLAAAIAAGCHGTSAAASTLTLAKGALKMMAWTKVKIAILTAVAVLAVAGTTTVVVEKNTEILRQRLPNGSLLALNRLSYGTNHVFVHGTNTINWYSAGNFLVVEFKLVNGTTNDPLVKPAFYRQYRCVIHDEQGIEFVEEFASASGFAQYSDGIFGYILSTMFPRDSHWLWFRIEKSEARRPYHSWSTVAEFKIKNPATPKQQAWIATSTPATNTIDSMQFVLGNVTVQNHSPNPQDIYQQAVTIPTQVFDHGALLTNWSARFIGLEDASGNWNSFFDWNSAYPLYRSLDPRYVWKLDMDFEPESDFPNGSTVTVALPAGQQVSVTNDVMGVPVTISWDGTWIDASMPTNHPDLGLKFVSAFNAQGTEVQPSAGGFRFQFRERYFYTRLPNGTLTSTDEPATVTLAVVPNLHTTFYVQPKLIPEQPPQAAAQ